MLDQIARVCICLAIGEILSSTGVLPFPGSVIGLMLLLLDLLRHGRLPQALSELADNVLALLGMLFVPVGLGVLACKDLLRAEMLPIAAAVVGGTLVALAVTAIVAEKLTVAEGRREALEASESSDVSA